MTIRALISGVLHTDPETRIGKSGKSFTTGKLRADAQDGGTTWISLVTFGNLADTLAALKAGDSVSVAGKVKLTAWVNKTTGEPAAGMDLVVDSITSLAAKPKEPRAQPTPKMREPETAMASAPFDDFDDWKP